MTTQNGQTSAPAKAAGGVPQYRLTGPVYVNDILYDQPMIDRAGDAGIVIYFKGIPNMNMEPVNEAAREMVKKHPLPGMSAIERLTQITPDAPTLQPKPIA